MTLDELLASDVAVPIIPWGDAVLHRPARPVTAFDAELWDLLATMFATNRAAHGAGLAASQIGVDLAVFVYDCDDASGRRRQGLVCNPRLARLPARCLQHETEHLDGVVVEDHLATKERDALRRQHVRVADRYPARWPVV